MIKHLAATALGSAAFLLVATNEPRSAAIQRFELTGSSGSTVVNQITVSAPTLLSQFREDFSFTSGIGEVRIGFKPTGTQTSGALPAHFPGPWVNGDIFLPYAGTWDISVTAYAEDRSTGVPLTLLYAGVAHPDEWLLKATQEGSLAGRPSYHFERIDGFWNQQMKLEHRGTVGQTGTLSIRCGNGNVRYRWGGPPAGDPSSEGGSYQVLRPDETLVIDPMPMASLWLRADNPACPVEICWMSQNLRR